MYRKYLRNLVEWKDSPERKPLMIRGARQVGKKYLVKNIFAEQHLKGKCSYARAVRIRHLSYRIKAGIRFREYSSRTMLRQSSPPGGISLFFWSGKGSSEFGFIVACRNYVIPIDVKKGRGTINSMGRFRDNNSFDFAIKVPSNNYSFDETQRILTVPFYEFPFLADELAENKDPLGRRICQGAYVPDDRFDKETGKGTGG